jgi:hypothetical protein
VNSQELNCLVSINSDQISGSNKQVYTTLEKALSEFINQTKWTDRDVKLEEKINCAISINIGTQPEVNRFQAGIQIQSTRPVYKSTYSTAVLNLKDDDFDFNYTEFEPLNYNQNSFDSNLVSTIVYYVYMILGADADTFKINGGQKYYKEAENVMLQAQQSGISAWSNQVGKLNRFLLIDNILDSKLKNFRKTMYDYHIKGLDNFTNDQKKAKQNIENSIISLQTIFNKSIGNYLIRVFFDAKADEIVNVYSDGPKTSKKQRLLQVMRALSSTNNSKWSDID